MWFFKENPTAIDAIATISSLPNGYQHVALKFKVASEAERLFIGLAVPIAVHKPNGGVKIENVPASGAIITLTEKAVTLWHKKFV